MTIGDDNVSRVDIGGSPARPAERRGDNLRRHPLAARDEQIARARREVAEHADGDAQFPVLARGFVNRCQQPASCGSGWDEPARDVAVPAEERGRGTSSLGRASRRGRRGAFEQKVGDAAERGGDDHERTFVPADQLDRPLDCGDVGERRPAKLPDFERALLCGCHGHLIPDEAEAAATPSMARRTAS